MKPDKREHGESFTRFVQELTNAQFDLHAFVCVLLGNRDAAKDVLQNTNMILLRHAAEYDAGRPFLPWAKAFAHNQIRAYLKREKRSRMVFDDSLVAALAEECREEPEESGRALDWLDACLEELTAMQKALIRARYFQRESIPVLAKLLKRSEISVYVQIHRIRRLLGVCIEKKAQAEGRLGAWV